MTIVSWASAGMGAKAASRKFAEVMSLTWVGSQLTKVRHRVIPVMAVVSLHVHAARAVQWVIAALIPALSCAAGTGCRCCCTSPFPGPWQ